MKAIFNLAVICAALLLFSCNSKTGSVADVGQESSKPVYSEKPGHYGVEINKKGAIDVATLSEKLEKYGSGAVKVKGEISDVCAVKGCWMTVKNGDQDMRVTFKDYGFFVPKDAAGKSAVMEGIAKVDTTSVEMLRHFAEDAGKSPEEVAKITEPEVALSFEATGVIIE